MENNVLKDFFNREIREGDIVVRAIHSSLDYHKVLKITEKGVTLSRGRTRRTYLTWYGEISPGRYGRLSEPVEREYFTYSGGISIEEAQQHEGSIYVLKRNTTLILI